TPLPPNFNSVSGTIGGGSFSMNTDNATKASSALTYTLSGAASNLSGASGITLGFQDMDPGAASSSVPVTISIVTSTGTLTDTTTIAGNTNPFTQTFALSSFTGSGNLGHVNSIRITINGGASSETAVDFAMDEVKIKTVPAPPALVLAAIGFVGLIGRNRFLRKAA
ncbi:MAG TPA: hypothetical protein VH092_25930, partial [Urbifossiella sp.]|nr:hypothetical protein [Urbifossiella sp.]